MNYSYLQYTTAKQYKNSDIYARFKIYSSCDFDINDVNYNFWAYKYHPTETENCDGIVNMSCNEPKYYLTIKQLIKKTLEIFTLDDGSCKIVIKCGN